MAPSRTEQRSRLVDEAIRLLDDEGPQALQARTLTARVGTSTQAVYTLFGGMPGLVDAVVAAGFAQMAHHVGSVAETDDPVADHCVRGMAYCDWAFGHAPLYRLMFGVTGAGGSPARAGFVTGSPDTIAPEARAGLELLEHSVRRMADAGRIGTEPDAPTVARQFLALTHGYVLLDLGGVFGDRDSGEGLMTLASLVVSLLIGLGDGRDRAQQSLVTAMTRFTAGPEGG